MVFKKASIDPSTPHLSCEDEYYFEISEILHLFHQAHKQKKTNLSETTIKLILQLYYDTHTINKGKIIHNLKCTFWDKQKEIDDAVAAKEKERKEEERKKKEEEDAKKK